MDTNYEIGVEDNEIIHTFSETMTLEEVVERFNLTPEQTIQLEELVRQQAQELGWNVVDTIEGVEATDEIIQQGRDIFEQGENEQGFNLIDDTE